MKVVCLEVVAQRSSEKSGNFEVSKISSQDQMLHGVPVRQMIEQLMNVPKNVLQFAASTASCLFHLFASSSFLWALWAFSALAVRYRRKEKSSATRDGPASTGGRGLGE